MKLYIKVAFIITAISFQITAMEQKNKLIKAVKQGNITAIDAILAQKHVNINAYDQYGNTLLACALKSDKLFTKDDIIKLLIKHGIDVNKASHGKSPLQMAVEQDELDIVENLIKAGANVNIIDKYGNTPIYAALLTNNPAMVTALARTNINFNAPNECGITPIVFTLQDF